MGAPINIDDPECDKYTIGSAWNNAYNISTVKMCYPGDGTVQAEFILGKPLDNVEFSYIKNLYPAAKFSMPAPSYIDIPVSSDNVSVKADDLGIFNTNTDNESRNNQEIDFSKPVSIDNTSKNDNISEINISFDNVSSKNTEK